MSGSSQLSAVDRNATRHWFTNEIQHMMYGFGDCSHPLPESAKCVENIVYGQMLQLLQKVEDVSVQRSSKQIGIEDFLFLLRKDKSKLKRLLLFLKFKDLKSSTTAGTGLDDEDVTELDEKPSVKRGKRQKICGDYLSYIDPMGELVALMDDSKEDEVKRERNIRAELMTRNMDSKQYMAYCEARQASFTPKYKTQKFRDWLLADLSLEAKLNPYAMEILSYMAYESVAQIVDLALAVRKDKSAVREDPLSLEMEPVSYNYDPIVAAGELKSGYGSGLLTAVSGSATIDPLTGVAVSSFAALPNRKPPKVVDRESHSIATSQAIQPCEILEALRRYCQPIGPFADFSKAPLLNVVNYLLCC